jgi:hypothetical protein
MTTPRRGTLLAHRSGVRGTFLAEVMQAGRRVWAVRVLLLGDVPYVWYAAASEWELTT